MTHKTKSLLFGMLAAMWLGGSLGYMNITMIDLKFYIIIVPTFVLFTLYGDESKKDGRGDDNE